MTKKVLIMENKTTISIQILFLNDLFFKKVIDEDIYNKAIQNLNALSIADVSTLSTSA